MNTQTRHSLMLMLCAMIWGTAFVAQSAGSGMGAYSFLAGRSWLAVLVLLPTVYAFDALRRRRGEPTGRPQTAADRKTLGTAGFVCGTFLFAASAAQQIGITLNPSTAKAAFLTAMYVVMVPVFGLFVGRRGSARLWLSMVIAVGGLYLLCMKNGFGGIEPDVRFGFAGRPVEIPEHVHQLFHPHPVGEPIGIRQVGDDLLRLRAGDHARDLHHTLGGLQQTVCQFEQRGLAAAVRAQQADDAAKIRGWHSYSAVWRHDRRKSRR